MPVKRGKVVERRLFVEIEEDRHFLPKGCDPIIGRQLEVFAGKEIEALMAKDMVLAIRAVRPEEVKPLPPIIVCYLCPPDIVFDPGIMARIEPLITESLVESGFLDKQVAGQLREWQERYA